MSKEQSALLLLSLSIGFALAVDICEYQMNGVKLAHPADCNKFVECQNGKTHRFLNCPLGLHFNRFKGVCDLRQRAACDIDLANFVNEEANCSSCCALYGCFVNPECPQTPDVSTTTVSTDTTLTSVTTSPETPNSSITSETTMPVSSDTPATAQTTDNPNAPVTSSSPATSDISPSSPDTPETPGSQSTSASSGPPITSTTPVSPETPTTAQTPVTDVSSANTDIPDTPVTPGSPDTPYTPETSDSPSTPAPTGTPNTPTMPVSSETPATAQTPDNPNTPGTDSSSSTSDIPDTPPTPETPSSTGTFANPETPITPDTSKINQCQNNLTACKGKDDNSVVHANGTCEQYIVCGGGCSYVMNCPAGLQYDIAKEMCDYPQNVNCPWQSAPPITGPSGLTCAQHGQCAGKPDGTMFASFEHNNYIVCQCQCEIERPCPKGMKFDKNQMVCTWPDNVSAIENDSGNKSKNETKVKYGNAENRANETGNTTDNVNFMAVICPNGVEICKNQSNGILFSVEGFCNKFYKCNFGCAVEILCPDNLIYNPNAKNCDYQQNYKCPWPYTPLFGPSPGPSEMSCASGGRCMGKTDGIILPSLTSCSKYIVCQYGCEVERECSKNLYWDRNLLTCNHPENVICESN